MSRIAGLSRSTACSRASSTTSGSRLATACWQKECDSGVSRCDAHGSGQPEAALEELAVGVDERDERDGRVEDLGGEARVAVEGRVDVRVQQPRRLQRADPLGVARGGGRVEQRLPALGAVGRRSPAGTACVRPSAASKSGSPRWPIA